MNEWLNACEWMAKYEDTGHKFSHTQNVKLLTFRHPLINLKCNLRIKINIQSIIIIAMPSTKYGAYKLLWIEQLKTWKQKCNGKGRKTNIQIHKY